MAASALEEPYRLRLVVHRRGDAYTARFVEPGGQESEAFPLTLPLEEADQNQLSWYLEDYVNFVGAGDRVRAEEVEKKINDWGRALYEALFENPEGARVHLRLLDAARDGRRASLTVGTDLTDVHVQPWEMMRDRRGPLVFRGVTIRRQLLGAGEARSLKLALPLRVLMITSRPRDAGFIDPRVSVAPVLDALEVLDGHARVDYCEPPTLARLEEMISAARRERQPYHVVHFDGHGAYLPHTGVGALAFEADETGTKTHLVAGRDLGDLLSRLEVPLVMLEACRSSALTNRPVFGSVAPALLQSGVGSVVAFSHSVHVEAAKLLVERFYKELTGGMTVGQSLEEARARLLAQPKRWLTRGPDPETIDLQDWFIPQLYQVGGDPAIVSTNGDDVTDESETPRTKTKHLLHGFPPPPMYRFHGRAQEILQLERALRCEPAVLLTGMGGMGKTALAREAAAWWLRKRRFEAAVFHSFEQKAGAERVVQVLGRVLEGDAFSSRPADEQWNAAVELFRTRRVLLVWDNFESTLPEFQKGDDGATSPLEFSQEDRQRLRQLYRELTEEMPEGRLLVTCRPQETGLDGVKKNPLAGLARHDSRHLLAAVLYKEDVSTDRKGYERDKVDALLKAVDDHPLSISLVAPHLKTLTPDQILAELRQGLDRFADGSAEEARNRSLLASLDFSTRRLSESARGVLPYLAWFEGGTMELNLLNLSQLDAAAWEAVRGELVATALIRVEEIPVFTTPFLRFHPTLPYAARPEYVADVEAVETRFLAVYLSVMQEVDKALFGRQPAVGMALLTLEEANSRSALRRAFRRGARREGASMANTLGRFLEMAGRRRERDHFVAWVRSQLPEDAGLDEATCGAIRQHALGLTSQGKADEAVVTVRGLIARLEAEGLLGNEDPAFQIAISHGVLGKIYVLARRPDLAVEASRRAVVLLEELPGDAGKSAIAASLADLAHAHRELGQLGDALAAAERALTIFRDLGSDSRVAGALDIIGEILSSQERYSEADVRYGEAFDAARSAGDLELQGAILQHQAILQRRTGNPGRAVELYRKALVLIQKAGSNGAEMRTCNLLGSAEQELGHLDAAEAWYSRSRELAEARNDRHHLAVVAHNVGILHQMRAEQAGNSEDRAIHLGRAVASIEESLAEWLEMGNQVNAASSYCQLGQTQRMLGELSHAEDNLRQGLEIFESLNLPNVYMVYGDLAAVAVARGDAKAAAEWQAKRDAKLAEVERLRRGGGVPDVPAQVVEAVLALARVVHDARVRRVALLVEAAEAVARLAGMPAPFGDVGRFLQEVADGGIPSVPSGVPSEIGEVLSGLLEAVKRS